MSQEKSAAVLTIKDADRMTNAGRKRVAEWLREQAEHLQEHGDQYASRFRARYIYMEG